MKNQNQVISFLQAWGILLVVLGHSFQGTPERFLFWEWIYSFHMPLFMFISGWLLRYGCEVRQCELSSFEWWGRCGFVWKKVKRLLVPYVAISTLAFFPKALLGRFALRPVSVSWEEYMKMLVYPWDNVIIFFWFLPTLFLVFLLFVCGSKLFSRLKWAVPGRMLLLLLLPHWAVSSSGGILNYEGVLYYLFYFAFGYVFCLKHWLEKGFSNLWTWTFATFLFSLLLVAIIPGFFGKDLLNAVTGILFSVFLGKLYIAYRWTFFHHLFGASYTIYLLSWFPQTFFQQILLRVTDIPWQVGSLLAFCGGVYIPLLFGKWIMRNKEKPWGKVVAFIMGQ